MSKIYDQHSTAFSNVSAFVILKNGERVATVAFKFPKDGAGRLYCYMHLIGTPMVRGFANGYGYDKASAATIDAATKLHKTPEHHPAYQDCKDYNAAALTIQMALQNAESKGWERALVDAGYLVLQAV